MARRVAIQNATIIAATQQLILKNGVDVTTREIAEVAGVSEGTIFRRFVSKENLMQEALFSVFKYDFLEWLDDVKIDHSFYDILARVVTEASHYFRPVMPLHMAALAHFGQKFSFIELAHKYGVQPPPVRFAFKLERYLEKLSHQGFVVGRSVEVLAGTFLGAIIQRVFRELSDGKRATKDEDLDFAGELLKVISMQEST